MSVDGLLGSEAECFLSRLGIALTEKWDKLYSLVMNWARTTLVFATLQAILLCVCGSRTKWRCLGVLDGASIPALE